MNWYKDVLGFKSTLLVDDEYQYCNLESETGITIGIANADQMGVKAQTVKTIRCCFSLRFRTLMHFLTI